MTTIREEASVQEKNDALEAQVRQVMDAHGYVDYNYVQNPTSGILHMRSRYQRLRDWMETPAGDYRLWELYWEGQDDSPSVPGTEHSGGLSREGGGVQHGAAHTFRAVGHFGPWEEDGSTFDDWKALMEGHDPQGLLPALRETRTVTAGGSTVALSVPSAVAVPPIARPLDDSGHDRAHYIEFTVILTDY